MQTLVGRLLLSFLGDTPWVNHVQTLHPLHLAVCMQDQLVAIQCVVSLGVLDHLVLGLLTIFLVLRYNLLILVGRLSVRTFGVLEAVVVA